MPFFEKYKFNEKWRTIYRTKVEGKIHETENPIDDEHERKIQHRTIWKKGERKKGKIHHTYMTGKKNKKNISAYIWSYR